MARQRTMDERGLMFRMFLDGNSAVAIGKSFGIKNETVISHINKYVKRPKIRKIMSNAGIIVEHGKRIGLNALKGKENIIKQLLKEEVA